jgi:hypothetical protein
MQDHEVGQRIGLLAQIIEVITCAQTVKASMPVIMPSWGRLRRGEGERAPHERPKFGKHTF